MTDRSVARCTLTKRCARNCERFAFYAPTERLVSNHSQDEMTLSPVRLAVREATGSTGRQAGSRS
jgi:hypothetical protein